VAIVDLRGREQDAEVQALLGRPWPEQAILIGWSDEAGELVGGVAVARAGSDDLALLELAVPEDRAPAMLADLEVVVTAQRLVAETDQARQSVYAACGFETETLADGRVRCTKALDVAPVAAPARTLAEVEAAIRAAWSRETSDDPDEWTEDNPARGQCAVTSLLVRELLGGDILIANVVRDGKRVERHAWNRLASGITLDLTREQFLAGEQLTEAAVEEPLITHRTPERYEALRARVFAALDLVADSH
jgi:hypothetical protein